MDVVEGVSAVRLLAESDWEFDRVRASWAASERHPDAALVGAAVAMFDAEGFESQYPLAWSRGRQRMPDCLRFELRVGPGVVGLRVHDPARASWVDNPALPIRCARRFADERHPFDVVRGEAAGLSAAHLAGGFLEARRQAEAASGLEGSERDGVITCWSRRSRSRMVERIAEIDWKPLLAKGIPAMVTLTYPGDWLAVAPSGRAVKRHMEVFRKRFARAWGEPLVGLWKLEFQRRGAPHIHCFIVPPSGRADGMSFPTWLSRVWADVVAHPDPEQRRRHLLAGTGVDRAEGLRALDPRRLAVYFLKHSSKNQDDKEYQHIVPEPWRQPGRGPGRFWGVWGSVGRRVYRADQRRHVRAVPELRRAVVKVEVDRDDFLAVKRIIRRWSRAQRRTRVVVVPRVDRTTGELRYRPVTRRAVRLDSSRLVGGFVIVNGGPAFASQLARAVSLRT